MVLDRIFVAVFVIGILILGGLFHAAVPHSHGNHSHEDTSEGSVIWKELHSSLRHEEKKAVYMLVEQADFPFAFVLSRETASTHRVTATNRSAYLQDPKTRQSVRSGIERYVRFG